MRKAPTLTGSFAVSCLWPFTLSVCRSSQPIMLLLSNITSVPLSAAVSCHFKVVATLLHPITSTSSCPVSRVTSSHPALKPFTSAAGKEDWNNHFTKTLLKPFTPLPILRFISLKREVEKEKNVDLL